MLITANLRCVCLNWPKNAIEATQEEPSNEGGPKIGTEPKHNVEDNSAHQQINISACKRLCHIRDYSVSYVVYLPESAL
jgi:hypothetical protein